MKIKHGLKELFCVTNETRLSPKRKANGLEHNKKLDNLRNETKVINGISDKPNSVIRNLSSRNLNNMKYKILTYGLKHGIAISPKQNNILASIEGL